MIDDDWFETKYSILRWWKQTFVYRAYLQIIYRVVPKHRYHMIYTGMKPGYYDISVRMEAALAKLVIDFVEKERFVDSSNFLLAFDERIDFLKTEYDKDDNWPGDFQEYVQKELEFKELYMWCREWYSTLTNEDDPFYNEEANDYDMENRKRFDEEVNKRMIQIVEFRNWMWT